MENPVNYNDLFSPTLKEDIGGLLMKLRRWKPPLPI
jgi:hypothetical protein